MFIPVVTVSDGNLMPWLLEEFPYIHISPQTLHQMWNKSARQLEQLSKVQREVKCKKSKAEVQVSNMTYTKLNDLDVQAEVFQSEDTHRQSIHMSLSDTHTHTQTHRHICTHNNIHSTHIICTQTHTHIHMHYIFRNTEINLYTHRDMCVQTHTHTHTHTGHTHFRHTCAQK